MRTWNIASSLDVARIDSRRTRLGPIDPSQPVTASTNGEGARPTGSAIEPDRPRIGGIDNGKRLSRSLAKAVLFGRAWRIRIADQRIKSPLLYQLS
jgi:hypothetical protein